MKLISQYRGLRKEIYILFIGRIVTRFGSMVWSMLTLILSQKFFYSASQISVFMFIFNIVTVLAGFAGGKLADSFNKRNIIIAFDCVSILFYAVCAVIPLSNISIVLIVIAATFQWAEHPAYNAIIADLTLSEDRERAYALQYLGTNIGLMVAPTLAGFLFNNYMNLLFIICSLAIAVSTVLIIFKVKDIKPVVEEDKVLQKRRDGDSLWTVLKDNKIFFLFFICMGLYSAGYQQSNYLMPLDLGRIYGENGAVLFGTLSSTNCITVVVFSPIILSLFSKIKPTVKILIAQVLLILGFVIFLFQMNYIPACYLSIMLFTFGEIFAMIGASPFMSNHSPASHRGQIEGTESVVSYLISSFLMLVIGRIYDSSGSSFSWLFVISIMIISLLSTIVMVVKDKKTSPFELVKSVKY